MKRIVLYFGHFDECDLPMPIFANEFVKQQFGVVKGNDFISCTVSDENATFYFVY